MNETDSLQGRVETSEQDYDDCVENGGHEWYKHGERTRIQWTGADKSSVLAAFHFTTYTVFRCTKCHAIRETIIPVVQI